MRHNKDFHLFKSSKTSVLKAFTYISKLSDEKTVNAFFNLSRTTRIKDADLEYLLHYLRDRELIEISQDSIKILEPFEPEMEVNNFVEQYISELVEYKEINSALFVESEFVVEKDVIKIHVNSVPLRFRPIFGALQSLGALEPSVQVGFVDLINFGMAKKMLERPLKRISLAEFEKQMEEKKIRGEKAELFVLEFERIKLQGLPWKPTRVSISNVSLGYDIKSYTVEGERIYIEVKTIVNGEYFYWSANEISASQQLEAKYLIFCVQFNNHNEPTKIVKILRNPYSQVFHEKRYAYRETGDYKIFIK